MSEGTAWVIAPPAVSLQIAEPEELRKQWRIARFDAVDPEQLVIALGQHVPGSYHDVTAENVRSVVPVDLQGWIDVVRDRQRALADGFGRHDPRLAPNEEHVRAASTRFAELAGATASARRAREELHDAVVDVPDTVDEFLGRATAKTRAWPAQGGSAGVVAAITTLTAPARQDAIAMMELLAHARVERERPGSAEHSYLDEVIAKPWGREFRVYDDAFVDVWLLQLNAGTQTSMHCHARKDTVLACLHGEGMLIAGDGRHIPFAQGSVLHIQQGAAHRALTRAGMTLVDIETPRDKFDHLRLEDDSGRAGWPYEGPGHVQRRLDPLTDAANGPPRARLRPRSATEMYRFTLERGLDLQPPQDGLMFAISLDAAGILRREITIVAPEALTAAIRPEHTYLTIRATALATSIPDRPLAPRSAVRRAGAAHGRSRGRELCGSSVAENLASPRTTRAVILTAPGLQDHDTLYTYYRAKEAGFDVEVATAGAQAVTAKSGVPAPLDKPAKPCIASEDLDVDDFDLVVLSGGHDASERLRSNRRVLEFVREMDACGKVVASLCDGHRVMIWAGITRGRRVCADAAMREDMINAGAEVKDADVIADRNIVTCSHHGAVGPFMKTVIKLCKDRTPTDSAASPLAASSPAPDQLLQSGPSRVSPSSPSRAACPHPEGDERSATQRRRTTRRLLLGGTATLMALAAAASGWLLGAPSPQLSGRDQPKPKLQTKQLTVQTPATSTALASSREREERTNRRRRAPQRASESRAAARTTTKATAPISPPPVPPPPPAASDPTSRVSSPVDRDGDGIPNRQDACPNKPARTSDGCPGTAASDTQPATAGGQLPRIRARADSDGDGLPNRQDSCPNKPADTASACPENPPATAPAGP